MNAAEYGLACAVARVLSAAGLRFHHSPNETPDAARAALNKRAGVSPGFPDVVIVSPSPRKSAAIELKVGERAPTSAQRAWLRDFEEAGFSTRILRAQSQSGAHIHEACDELVKWLRSEGVMG